MNINYGVWLNFVKEYLKDNDYLLITDGNVYNIYQDEINRIIKKSNIYIINPGEDHKNLNTLVGIYEKLIDMNISRKGYILSLGGGVVGDISGFAASTYKRGIGYIQIPTTLIGQVDSSIGGKTAIDFKEYKNMIGTFYFPEKVIVDINFLKTLRKEDLISGLGEIIKYGLIYDYDLFIYIKNNVRGILNKDLSILQKLVNKSIFIKSEIVKKDKLDFGIRRTLNFGHTIGHGLESFYNYKKYTHGEAIIQGMIYETELGYKKGLIDLSYRNEIISFLYKLTSKEILSEEDIDNILKYIRQDKKNYKNKLIVVLPKGKGIVDIFDDIKFKDIKNVLMGEIKVGD